MTDIRTLLAQADSRLRGALPKLAHIGRNPGPEGAARLPRPCALLDAAAVDFTQQGHGGQLAEAQLTVEVAGPDDDAGYDLFGLLDRIHGVLRGLAAGGHAPLRRIRLERAAAGSYLLTYRTSFAAAGDDSGATAPVRSVELRVE